jgi:hypothetical protein
MIFRSQLLNPSQNSTFFVLTFIHFQAKQNMKAFQLDVYVFKNFRLMFIQVSLI